MRFVDEGLDSSMLQRWVRLDVITANVVRLGVSRGYLSNRDAIDLMLQRMNAGLSLSPNELEIALLLSDDVERVPELLGGGCPPDQDATCVWLYVGLKEIREEWDNFENPWDQIAELVDSAGRPERWTRFVYYDRIPFFRRPKGLKSLLVELDQAISHLDAQLGR